MSNEIIVTERHLKILHERAVALSGLQRDKEIENLDTIYVVSFLLSGETYCIEANYVKEVLPLKELTVVPCTPAFILGVINIRGQIYTVLNLKKVFRLLEKGISEFNKVMIIQSENISFCVVADAIIGTQYILRSSINPAPFSKVGKKKEYVSGVTSEGLILLDGEILIKSNELVVNNKGNKENNF